MEKLPVKLENYRDEYSESGLKDKLAKIAKKAGIKVVYAVLIAFYAVQSETVSMADKARVYGALGYFIMPIDLVPDSIPMLGFSDDLAALLFVLHTISANITPEVKKKAASRLRDWFGDFDQEELDSLL